MCYMICSALQPIVGYSHNLDRGATINEPVGPQSRCCDPIILEARRHARAAFLVSPELYLCSPFIDGRLTANYRREFEQEELFHNEAVEAICKGVL